MAPVRGYRCRRIESAFGGRRRTSRAGVIKQVGHVHQLGERAGLHLRHYLRAMHLDCALADPELVGDLLVELSCHNVLEYRALTLREPGEARLRLADAFPLRTGGPVAGQRSLDSSYENRRFHRLREKVDGTGLHVQEAARTRRP